VRLIGQELSRPSRQQRDSLRFLAAALVGSLAVKRSFTFACVYLMVATIPAFAAQLAVPSDSGPPKSDSPSSKQRGE